jgi:hypothetical protein
MMSGQKAKWRQAMTDCLSALMREQSGSSCPVVDYELRTSPTGDPDDMRVWFICRTKMEKDEFIRTERSRSISVFKKKMLAAGFSDSAVASVEIKIISRDEIEKAGGSSSFFR